MPPVTADLAGLEGRAIPYRWATSGQHAQAVLWLVFSPWQAAAVTSARVKKPASATAFEPHLRGLREHRGWSQQELADVADITKKTVYRIETAQTSPTLDVLVCLAEGLEFTLPELLRFTTAA